MHGKEKNATQNVLVKRENTHTHKERERAQNVKGISILFLISYRAYDFEEDTISLSLFPYLRNGLTVPNSCGCYENQASFPQGPCTTDSRGDALHNYFLCFLSLLSSLSIHKTCLLQQRLPATCHPNASTEATCPPNPNTTQADESLNLNKAYQQSGEMRGFSWAGKRKCVQVSRRGPFHGLYIQCLTYSAWGRSPFRFTALKRWSLLSIVILTMKFSLSSRQGQTG